MKTEVVNTCSLKEDTTFKYIFTYNYIAKYIINLFLDFIGSNLKVEVINIVPQNYIIDLIRGQFLKTMKKDNYLYNYLLSLKT